MWADVKWGDSGKGDRPSDGMMEVIGGSCRSCGELGSGPLGTATVGNTADFSKVAGESMDEDVLEEKRVGSCGEEEAKGDA